MRNHWGIVLPFGNIDRAICYRSATRSHPTRTYTPAQAREKKWIARADSIFCAKFSQARIVPFQLCDFAHIEHRCSWYASCIRAPARVCACTCAPAPVRPRVPACVRVRAPACACARDPRVGAQRHLHRCAHLHLHIPHSCARVRA
jgi:hypothetical protein